MIVYVAEAISLAVNPSLNAFALMVVVDDTAMGVSATKAVLASVGSFPFVV